MPKSLHGTIRCACIYIYMSVYVCVCMYVDLSLSLSLSLSMCVCMFDVCTDPVAKAYVAYPSSQNEIPASSCLEDF